MSSKKDAAPSSSALAPMFHDRLGLIGFVGSTLVITLVALHFSLEVNRVFDAPKALALKVGGCGLFLGWLLYGTFGPGYVWRGLRLFFTPVLALASAVVLSTLLSIDRSTSLYGVYERQFGLQGFLGCVGLFLVTASALGSKRGALVGFSALLTVGAIVGAYGYLQARGLDPYGFFTKPATKVYSTLGNATFAGNALALIFPISALVAITQSSRAVFRAHRASATVEGVGFLFAGLLLTLLLQLVLPSLLLARPLALSSRDSAELTFKMLMGSSVLLLAGAASLGQGGPLSAANPRLRLRAESVAAGALGGMVVSICVGLVVTRTRGAWVGASASICLGLALLPVLFADAPRRTVIRVASVAWSVLIGVVLLGIVAIVTFPNHLYVRTVKSIAAAFDPEQTTYGTGQGTRRYLWTESPRVLVRHVETLARLEGDDRDYIEHVTPGVLSAVPVDSKTEPSEVVRNLSRSWRRVAVFFFGIGIETYRYAFMSHKSKKLEALDPMTNHDNPHNNYLYVLASFGLVGLAAYLWMLWRLLSVAFRRFLHLPRRLLATRGDVDALVRDWQAHEAKGPDNEALRFVALETVDQRSVVEAIEANAPRLVVRREKDKVLVGGASVDEVLDRLRQISVASSSTRSDRAIAFGIVTSFASYAIYSIAGFDSVACSVFFYFLLGCSAAYFAPSAEERPTSIVEEVRRSWSSFRGRSFSMDTSRTPLWATVALLVVAGLLLHSAIGGVRVWRAEIAFVGRPCRGEDSSYECFLQKVSEKEEAVRRNPRESFYRQALGNAYSNAGRERTQEAMRAERKGQEAIAKTYATQAEVLFRKAEAALYSALDHAWAPENVFISLFQLYYTKGDLSAAERALERALEHSPHLGAVRANLAVLKLERGAHEEAVKDCLWVMEVDRANATAERTCGRAYFLLRDYTNARRYLSLAEKHAPKDPLVRRYLTELSKASTAAASQDRRG